MSKLKSLIVLNAIRISIDEVLLNHIILGAPWTFLVGHRFDLTMRPMMQEKKWACQDDNAIL
jgi:hypothetical protein